MKDNVITKATAWKSRFNDSVFIEIPGAYIKLPNTIKDGDEVELVVRKVKKTTS